MTSIVVKDVHNKLVVNDIDGTAVVAKEKGNTVVVTGVIGGVSQDAHFVYTQSSPSAQWVITHNLAKYPSITVVDSAKNVVYGEVLYDSVNQVTLTFAGAFSGEAFFN
jgi:hypothetical protein